MNEEMTTKLNEIREQLPIDQYQLEIECMGQPALYAEVGELASLARADAKTAKEHVDYVYADLSSKIRKDPDAYKLVKTTEDSIKSAVLLQPEYQDAVKASIEAARIADSLGVLQTATEQRKSMIKDLVSLFVYSYYSSNKEMTGEKTAVEKVTQEDIVRARVERAGRREEVPEEIE